MERKETDREALKQMFKIEYDRIDKGYQILENHNINIDALKIEYADLLNAYSSLLNDTMKITRIGDKSQSKLVKAREKIEHLNEKLSESEKNIKELNTILMHYIDATEKK